MSNNNLVTWNKQKKRSRHIFLLYTYLFNKFLDDGDIMFEIQQYFASLNVEKEVKEAETKEDRPPHTKEFNGSAKCALVRYWNCGTPLTFIG